MASTLTPEVATLSVAVAAAAHAAEDASFTGLRVPRPGLRGLLRTDAGCAPQTAPKVHSARHGLHTSCPRMAPPHRVWHTHTQASRDSGSRSYQHAATHAGGGRHSRATAAAGARAGARASPRGHRGPTGGSPPTWCGCAAAAPLARPRPRPPTPPTQRRGASPWTAAAAPGRRPPTTPPAPRRRQTGPFRAGTMLMSTTAGASSASTAAGSSRGTRARRRRCPRRPRCRGGVARRATRPSRCTASAAARAGPARTARHSPLAAARPGRLPAAVLPPPTPPWPAGRRRDDGDVPRAPRGAGRAWRGGRLSVGGRPTTGAPRDERLPAAGGGGQRWTLAHTGRA